MRSTGNTAHLVARHSPDGRIEIDRVPVPMWVEIVEEDERFFLRHFSGDGDCIADTWHPTVDEAKEQALFEFGILADQWALSTEEFGG